MMELGNPFPSDRGPLWSARLGHEADAIVRETGMMLPLPGMPIPVVSAATPPHPDRGTPPQAPARMKAALTFLDNHALSVIRAVDGDVRPRFLRTTHLNRVQATQDP